MTEIKKLYKKLSLKHIIILIITSTVIINSVVVFLASQNIHFILNFVSSSSNQSDYIDSILLIFLSCTIVFSAISCFILIKTITVPIKVLLDGLRNVEPGMYVLPETNIVEFDELAKSIELRNTLIYRSSYKLVDIIDSSHIKLGVIEFVNNQKRIFCTKQVFDILSLNPVSWRNSYVNRDDIISQLTRRKECFRQSHDDPEVYLYRCPNLEDKWLHIAQVEKEDSVIVIFEDITKQQEATEELLRERDYDVLTNLYNRGAFAREMKKLIDDGETSNGILSIWDLDNLKYTNDTFGHDIGDKYICLLGNILSENLSVKSVCARLAGDEFTLFLYGAPNDVLFAHLKNLHKRLLDRELCLPNNEVIKVSASGGVSYYPEDGNCYKDLLKFADYSMYQIKHSSKGLIKKFDRESYIKDYILVNGIRELDRIITEQAIKYSYQPIYSMENNSVYAYEALIRPVSDLLSSPDNFLKVAQKESKLGQIERITWFLALRYFYKQVRPDDNAKLFINSIPDQLLSEDDVALLENEFGSDLSRVVLEITESSHAEDSVDSKKRNFCKKWNIPIALDDFGAGYSNSDMLVTRSFNFIKIDRSLIHDIDMSPSKQVFVSGIITYCHENGLQVIAEGIETAAEYDIMKKMGSDFAQGYFLKKPNGSLY